MPYEELGFFARVVELLRSGIEYHRLLDDNDLYTESHLKEDMNLFMRHFRENIRSGKRYSFREWISIFSDLLDELD